MLSTTRSDNALISFIHGAGVLIAYGLLALSLYLSTDVPLATKGYWGIGVLLLTLSLINFVKYPFDDRLSADRLQRLDDARTEKLLAEHGGDKTLQARLGRPEAAPFQIPAARSVCQPCSPKALSCADLPPMSPGRPS